MTTNTKIEWAEKLLLSYWSLVRIRDSRDCWIWSGGTNCGGYGVFRGTTAHRWSYQISIGEIPEGLCVDHLCRNRACVNPLHLEAVTQQENVKRGLAGSLPEKCKRGHLWSDNFILNTSGRRVCRSCRRERDRKRRNAAYWREYRKKRKAQNGLENQD